MLGPKTACCGEAEANARKDSVSGFGFFRSTAAVLFVSQRYECHICTRESDDKGFHTRKPKEPLMVHRGQR